MYWQCLPRLILAVSSALAIASAGYADESEDSDSVAPFGCVTEVSEGEKCSLLTDADGNEALECVFGCDFATNQPCEQDPNRFFFAATCTEYHVHIPLVCLSGGCDQVTDTHGGNNSVRTQRTISGQSRLAGDDRITIHPYASSFSPCFPQDVVNPNSPCFGKVPFSPLYPIPWAYAFDDVRFWVPPDIDFDGDGNPDSAFITTAEFEGIHNFILDSSKAFAVDDNFFTGFSQGGVASWWMICNHWNTFAKVAPVSAGADPFGSACFFDGDPFGGERGPDILFISGAFDFLSPFENAELLLEWIDDSVGLNKAKHKCFGKGRKKANSILDPNCIGGTQSDFVTDAGAKFRFIAHNGDSDDPCLGAFFDTNGDGVAEWIPLPCFEVPGDITGDGIPDINADGPGFLSGHCYPGVAGSRESLDEDGFLDDSFSGGKDAAYEEYARLKFGCGDQDVEDALYKREIGVDIVRFWNDDDDDDDDSD